MPPTSIRYSCSDTYLPESLHKGLKSQSKIYAHIHLCEKVQIFQLDQCYVPVFTQRGLVIGLFQSRLFGKAQVLLVTLPMVLFYVTVSQHEQYQDAETETA